MLAMAVGLKSILQIISVKIVFNPFTTKTHLQILLCLTPDDFTRQRETPWQWRG